jgi:hypothetical protein
MAHPKPPGMIGVGDEEIMDAADKIQAEHVIHLYELLTHNCMRASDSTNYVYYSTRREAELRKERIKLKCMELVAEAFQISVGKVKELLDLEEFSRKLGADEDPCPSHTKRSKEVDAMRIRVDRMIQDWGLYHAT